MSKLSTDKRRLAAHRAGRDIEWKNGFYFPTGKKGVSRATGHRTAEYENVLWERGDRVWLDLVTGKVRPE